MGAARTARPLGPGLRRRQAGQGATTGSSDLSRSVVYWADLGTPRDSEPGYRRPVLVLQSDVFNDTGLRTVVVCALFSNLEYARFPGNVVIPTHVERLAARERRQRHADRHYRPCISDGR